MTFRQSTLFEYSKNLGSTIKCLEMGIDFSVTFHTEFQAVVSNDWARIVSTRGLGDLLLIGRQQTNQAPEPLPNKFVPKPSTVPVMISSLQKAVRRHAAKDARRSAYTLLFTDPLKLWRRLPIIMAEDTTITKDLGFLVWCMMAASTREWIARNDIVSKMLGVVHDMAENKAFDRHVAGLDHDHSDIAQATVLALLKQTNATADGVAWACYIRSLYGGMDGDMIMMREFATVVKTLTDVIPVADRPISPLIHKRPDVISAPDDIPWFAVDFHCWPNLLAKFPDQYGSKSDIKRIMWTQSSGVNLRDLDSYDFSLYTLQTIHKYHALKWLVTQFND